LGGERKLGEVDLELYFFHEVTVEVAKLKKSKQILTFYRPVFWEFFVSDAELIEWKSSKGVLGSFS